MIVLKSLYISPLTLKYLGYVEQFQGLWRGLETYTTALNMMRDVAEHGGELTRVLNILKHKELSKDLLQQIHKILASDTENPGQFKESSQPLTIMKGDVPAGFLDTADPDEAGPLLTKLTEWCARALDEESHHPLIIIAVFTAVFLQISPFGKKNLAVARFVIVLLMLRAGYAYAAYVPLDHVFSAHGDRLFRALKHNQASLEGGSPDWQLWLETFLWLLCEQAGTLNQRIHQKEKDFSHLPTLSGRILKLFEEHDRLQMKEIIKKTGGRRSTMKLRLAELVEQGYLKRHGQARSTWYSLV